MLKKKFLFLFIPIGIVIFAAGFFHFSSRNKSDKIVIDNPNYFENNNTNNMENLTQSTFEQPQTQPISEEEQLTAEKSAKEVTTEEKEDLREKKEGQKIEIKPLLVSWGFKKNEKTKKPEQRNVLDIDTVVIHSSYDDKYDKENPYNFKGIIREYKDYDVSPHYLIDRDGIVYQLLPDEYFAYHAGESKMPDGRTGVNAFSLGIELMNTTEDKYTAKQYDSLNELLTHLKEKYNIEFVVGHGQIAPERRSDPWNFDWSKVN